MNVIKKRLSVFLLAITGLTFTLSAQVGIKTNVIADALLSPNLGVEIGLAKHWSLDLTGEINFWGVNHHLWKHWLAQPEARYWFCDRFAGHFLGFHTLGGQYNFGKLHNNITFLGSEFKNLTDYRYQGWAAGAGVAYGYAWVLDKHWNIEAEVGVGWLYTRFDKFSCENCGRKLEKDRVHNYVGPTKLAVNFVYIF